MANASQRKIGKLQVYLDLIILVFISTMVVLRY